MKKYKIKYFFDGQGEVEIKAKSKKEAEEKWRQGDFDTKDEDEWGENYEIQSIE